MSSVQITAIKAAVTRKPILTLIKGDTRSAIINFKVDRCANGVDLKDLGWDVAYQNAEGTTDLHPLTIVSIDDEYINVQWLIHGTATSVAGDTYFQLEGRVNTADNPVVWQSGKRYITVTEDIQTEPSGTVEQKSQLNQLIANLTNVLPTLQTKINDALESNQEVYDKNVQLEGTIQTAVDTYNSDLIDLNQKVASATASAQSALQSKNSAQQDRQNVATMKEEVHADLVQVGAHTQLAQDYMQNAFTYQQNANASAVAAKTSQTNAKAAETNAKASQTNARTSQVNAVNSAADALSSAAEASASASNAKTSQTNAKDSQTKAKSSEQTVTEAITQSNQLLEDAKETYEEYKQINDNFISISKTEPNNQYNIIWVQPQSSWISVLTRQDLSGYATETYVNDQINNVINSAPEALNTLKELADALNDDANFATTITTQIGKKQDKIEDLQTIKEGAMLGSTALQSVPDTYRTAAQQDKIHDDTKQDVITDLQTIKEGATLGLTALQQVPSTYRTAAQQDEIHDDTKQDVISDIATIRSGASAGATAVQDVQTSLGYTPANEDGVDVIRQDFMNLRDTVTIEKLYARYLSATGAIGYNAQKSAPNAGMAINGVAYVRKGSVIDTSTISTTSGNSYWIMAAMYKSPTTNADTVIPGTIVTAPMHKTSYTVPMDGYIWFGFRNAAEVEIDDTERAQILSSVSLPTFYSVPVEDLAEIRTTVGQLSEDIVNKQDKLTAGDNITIVGNVISASGGKSQPKLVASVTTTEQVIQIDITEDLSGNPLNLKNFFIWVKSVGTATNTTQGYMRIYIYNESQNTYIFDYGSCIRKSGSYASIISRYINKVFYAENWNTKKDNLNLFNADGTQNNIVGQTGIYVQNQSQPGIAYLINNINKISVVSATGTDHYFGVGSMVLIWDLGDDPV